MALFGSRRKQKQTTEEYVSPGVAAFSPRGKRISIASREYRLFRERAQARRSWYEVLAGFAGGMLDVSFDEKTSKELKSAIDFTGLRIKPNSPNALFVISVIFFSFLGGFLYAFGVLGGNLYGVVVCIILGLGAGYYLMRYPVNLMKSMRIQASSQVVLAVLYMVVSMRITPNIERALRFTSSNISGVLAWDMRRLLWDIEMGRYYSANEALMDYIEKWKAENEEFSESLRLIIESQRQIPEKSAKTLDEALRIILDGTRDRMKHYSQELQMPVTVIHMMGIVLPILGSVMAPMAAIFMGNVVTVWHFVLGYNLVLPIIIIWFINNTLSKRPVTFSQVDVSKHPDLPPSGSFMIKGGKRRVIVPVLPLALLLAIAITVPSFLYFSGHPEYLIVPYEMEDGVPVPVKVSDPDPLTTLLMSILFTVGLAGALVVFFISTNIQRSRVEESVYKMESQFELALFQLGNRISGGTPLELAVEKARDDVKDMEIANLFEITLRNMRNFGMTFEQALVDPKAGSLRYYPSRLIQNVMRMITDTANRGVQFASESMLTVSRYMKNVRETQEYMRTLLSETTSSMNFQGYVMAPLIGGLIVSMSQVIIDILVYLGGRLEEMGFEEALNFDISQLLGSTTALTAPMFQLIIGLYLVQIITILAIFITKINRGDDRSMKWYLAGRMIIVGISVYAMVTVGGTLVFNEMIKGAIGPVT